MKKESFCLRVLTGFLILLMMVPSWTLAQSSGTSTKFTQEELDQMFAPVALYPDSLLAQILVAATFPNEVMQADQWVTQNENLKGDELNDALDKMDWDLSVKALVPFPKVLSMMSDKREWTQRMGDAFLAQKSDVMETIQSLRAKAHAQGNLKSTSEQRVVVKGDSIEIEAANPRVVYVPAYNPTVVYGSWWYPGYPPYAYNPYYPGYVYDPAYTGAGLITAGVFGFAAGIAVGSAWHSGWGHWNWGHHGHRDIHVNAVRNININRNDIRIRNVRTTTIDRVVSQRRVDSTGKAGVRTSGRHGAGDKPSGASVSRELQQRRTRAQVHQDKNLSNTNQERIRSDRAKMSREKTSGRTSDQTGRVKSAERSHGQRGRTISSERSQGQMGQSRSTGKQRGDSSRGGSSGGGKSRASGGAGHSGGGSHDKHQ